MIKNILQFLLFFTTFLLPYYSYADININNINKKNINEIKKSAENGDIQAQYYLGLCYETGRGVDQSYTNAFKWYSKAAQKNHAKSQYNIGFLYEIGEGIVKNQDEAIKYYRKAAIQGDIQAMHSLGLCYDTNKDIPKKNIDITKLYNSKNIDEKSEAMYNLGLLYNIGKTTIDQIEAAKWYRKAAEQNHDKSQFMLGMLYFNGKGVRQDYVEAYKWTFLSSSQGYAPAISVMDIITQKMTEKQIIEAKKRIGLWKK